MPLESLKEMVLLNEVGPGFFSEASHYGDHGQFTDEFYDLFTQVQKMKKVMKSPKWVGYMEATDRTQGTMMAGSARDAVKAITDLEDHLRDIDREFDRLNNNSGSKEE